MGDFITVLFLFGVVMMGFQFLLWLLSIILPEKAFEWLTGKFDVVLNIKRVWLLQVLLSGLLLKALYYNKYVFFMRLKWACLFCFGMLIAQSLANERKGWATAFGILAIIYNPIIPFHWARETWAVINIVTIAVALGSIIVLKKDGFNVVADKGKAVDRSN